MELTKYRGSLRRQGSLGFRSLSLLRGSDDPLPDASRKGSRSIGNRPLSVAEACSGGLQPLLDAGLPTLAQGMRIPPGKGDSEAEVRKDVPSSPTPYMTFVLVILFIVTLAFATFPGPDLQSPREGEAGVVEMEGAVLIEVHQDGSLGLDGRSVALSGLLEDLKTILAQSPQRPVMVRTHPRARYQSMIEVLDELRHAPDKGIPGPLHVTIPTERESSLLRRGGTGLEAKP